MSTENNDLEQENEQLSEEEAQPENGHEEQDPEAESSQSDKQQEVEVEEPSEDRPDYESMEKQELIDLLDDRDQQIEELQEQLTAMQDKHLRKVAELDNIQKRIKRERSEIKEQAKINALQDFLPINDDLQRTLNASEGLEIDEKFLDGVKMVSDKFENVLRQNDVERIDETMVPFDVDKHEAMMRQPAEDKDVESNTVLQVLENGYRIGDRTIRHAKVIVSE